MNQERLSAAKAIAQDAGRMGLRYFRDLGALDVTSKGVQDLVSNADLDVETFVRAQIAAQFPGDGIVGEEHENVPSGTGWTWVIDPIDGTANFVRGVPQWCVIIACVFEGETRVGVIYEPCTGELFSAAKGQGAFLGDRPMTVAKTEGLHDGRVGYGKNGRTPLGGTSTWFADLEARGGVFFHSGSGGLMLAYVAAGRLIGFTEFHMYPWDCMAGMLLIAEAGGQVIEQSGDAMLSGGGRVVAGAPAVFGTLMQMSENAFDQ
ncbi:inositol monophosphatase [Alphaproteobacteria bacterium KMM 3653]|uniref:Inositol-1-monophosphatase n=1 Tax=Harenicola maris TaxID=2841044 RepID=A0AAP2CQY6_9RHOB|nr:inositol monophosphatase [Harenicola maris]